MYRRLDRWCKKSNFNPNPIKFLRNKYVKFIYLLSSNQKLILRVEKV